MTSLHVGRKTIVCSNCAVYEPLISHKGGYASIIPVHSKIQLYLVDNVILSHFRIEINGTLTFFAKIFQSHLVFGRT